LLQDSLYADYKQALVSVSPQDAVSAKTYQVLFSCTTVQQTFGVQKCGYKPTAGVSKGLAFNPVLCCCKLLWIIGQSSHCSCN